MQDSAEEFFAASSSALPDDDSPTRRAIADALAASFRESVPAASPQGQTPDPVPSSSQHTPLVVSATTNKQHKQRHASASSGFS